MLKCKLASLTFDYNCPKITLEPVHLKNISKRPAITITLRLFLYTKNDFHINDQLPQP